VVRADHRRRPRPSFLSSLSLLSSLLSLLSLYWTYLISLLSLLDIPHLFLLHMKVPHVQLTCLPPTLNLNLKPQNLSIAFIGKGAKLNFFSLMNPLDYASFPSLPFPSLPTHTHTPPVCAHRHYFSPANGMATATTGTGPDVPLFIFIFIFIFYFILFFP
jgi:hypothetical protein